MAWWINNPPSQGDSFSWFRWFQQVYRFIRGENRTFNDGGTVVVTSAKNLSEDFLYPCDATSAGFTVTLPLAANYQYKKYCVKKVDSSSNVVTIGRSGSDTIDGATTATISTQWDSLTFVSNGVDKWHKINSSSGSSGPTEIAFGGVVWLTMIGGGGGGGSTTTTSAAGGGGGSGEQVSGFQIYVTPGASVSYSVGAGGAAATAGGTTTFGNFNALGGGAGVTDTGASGAGGGARGGAAQSPNNNGVVGTAEAPAWFGGGSGGSGNTASGESGRGAGSGGYFSGGLSTSGAGGSGGGGAASPYGKGGSGSRTDGGAAGSTEYGAGGGGAGGQSGTTPNTGGAGAGGYILISWLGGSQQYTSGSGTWTAPS